MSGFAAAVFPITVPASNDQVIMYPNDSGLIGYTFGVIIESKDIAGSVQSVLNSATISVTIIARAPTIPFCDFIEGSGR